MKIVNTIRKMVKSDLGGSALIYTISSFCNSAIPFVLLPVLTNYLTSAQYGVLSTFNAMVSLLTPFVCMGTTTAIQRKMIEPDAKMDEYLYNCFLVSAICELIVGFFVVINSGFIEKYTGVSSSLLPSFLLVLISTVFFNNCKVVMQMKNKTKSFAIYQNLSTLINVILSLFFVIILGLQLKGRIYGISLSLIITAFIGSVYLIRSLGLKCCVSLDTIKDIVFSYGLPLIPSSIKATVLTYTDRVFITNMVSLSATGIYSVGNQFSLPIMILETSFNTAYVPWLFQKLKDNNSKEKIVKFTYLYFLVITIVSLGWYLISIPLLRIFTPAEYGSAGEYIFWLSLGYAFNGMHLMVVNYIYYYKRVKIYSGVTVFVLLLNIILNYLLINYYGTVGAAQATMVSNFVSFLLTWILVSKICDMPWLYFIKKKKEV